MRSANVSGGALFGLRVDTSAPAPAPGLWNEALTVVVEGRTHTPISKHREPALRWLSTPCLVSRLYSCDYYFTTV